MIDSSMILKATFEKIIESINIGIFDLLHTGVALFCDKGFFIYCNKSFLKMYNLPESVIGKHITDYFLTGERGVMSSIRTRKMVICSSQTKNNVWGVSFRYPIQDEQGQLRGVVVESIPSNLDKDKLLALLDTVRNLEMKSYSFSEQKEAHKNSGLYTFEAIALLGAAFRVQPGTDSRMRGIGHREGAGGAVSAYGQPALGSAFRHCELCRTAAGTDGIGTVRL